MSLRIALLGEARDLAHRGLRKYDGRKGGGGERRGNRLSLSDIKASDLSISAHRV